MTSRLIRRLAAAALLTCAAPLSAQPDTVADRARLDRFFAEVDTDSTPGCVVGVARRGQPTLLRAYGLANLETGTPNTPATVFEAGSVSKQFTAAAVLMLAQQGRLSLDDDVRWYLPELPDYGTPVTLRQMLNHTSGLREWSAVAEIGGWPRGTSVYTQGDVLRMAARQRALNFAPGTEYLYSNTNYTLAAIVVERVSGMPFAEFTRRALFAPLGMAHTGWRDDFRGVVRGRADAYGSMGGGGWRLNMPFENTLGHAALLTTVEDLLRWNANLDAPSVGGDDFARRMQEPGRLAGGRAASYALGLDVGMRGGTPSVSHAGATGGYHSFLGRYPARGLSVALLCNAGSINTEEMGPLLADLFLPPPPPVAPMGTVPATTLSAAELAAPLGLYRNARTAMPVTVEARPGGFSVNGGAPYVARSATRFATADGSREARLLAPGEGGRGALHILRATGDTTRLVPVDAWRADASPADFAGEYTSDEADARVVIRSEGDALVLYTRPEVEMRLEPAYRDALQAPDDGWLFVFERDAGGRVTAMTAWTTRSRAIRFERLR
ncbi:serine hydrolase domain-containing protein [Longimicrobium sp.]|uniref:serine hydrolase domain-containing protein n=1 Tax=Longimicrobium sp. TaxID=2029185 RepID=UPI002E37DCAE|nr:serine hydrolase domain-containing protein [Longimicrobium sp.]HEX6039310.1 serine hydrolase domain-containing protein [Longimicrobium sp.]